MATPIYNFDAIHGRSSLRVSIECDDQDGQLDLSDNDVWLEIPASHIRKKLPADLADGKPMDVTMELIRPEVESLPTTPTPFAVVDETNLAQGFPVVLFYGTIYRNGYVGSPLDNTGGGNG